MNWLLGQLDANGDCLYATAVARWIKRRHPAARLTWAISSRCRSLLDGNPDVDEVLEIPVYSGSMEHRLTAWKRLENEVVRTLTSGHPCDRVALTQIWPSNLRKYDGTIRSSIFRSFEAITGEPVVSGDVASVPSIINPELNLNDAERGRSEEFLKSRGIDRFSHRIVFECSPLSGQSFVDAEFAIATAVKVVERLEDCCVILTTGVELGALPERVYSARELSVRENRALVEASTLFVGCGSGVTVVATTVPQVPMIQVLSSSASVFASLLHDYEHFGNDSSRLIEMCDVRAGRLAQAILCVCRDGIEEARQRFERRVPLHFDHYFGLLQRELLSFARYLDAAESVCHTISRYGDLPELTAFFADRIRPHLKYDSFWNLPSGVAQRELIAKTPGLVT